MLAVEIRDPREERLSRSAAGARRSRDRRAIEVDTSRPRLRERFAAAAEEERAGVATALRRAGADHIVLSTRGDWLRALGRALR